MSALDPIFHLLIVFCCLGAGLTGGHSAGKKGAHASTAVSSTVHNVALEEEIATAIRFALERLSLSSLAHISEGYSAGAVARTVRIIVTPRRVGMPSPRSIALGLVNFDLHSLNSDDAHSPAIKPRLHRQPGSADSELPGRQATLHGLHQSYHWALGPPQEDRSHRLWR